MSTQQSHEEVVLRKNYWDDIRGLSPYLTPDDIEYSVNISVRHKYIYVEITKCGCSTIKFTLQRIELDDPNFWRSDLKEIHVREFSPLLNPKQVGSFTTLLKNVNYLKFCFVRHPYTRILSAYLDKILRYENYRYEILRQLGRAETDPKTHVTFSEFVRTICKQPIQGMDWHWYPQYYQTMQDSISYDIIGRFERFEQDFVNIGTRIVPNFAVYFRSERRHATNADLQLDSYITQEIKDLIFEKFKIDFEYFGYEP